MSPEMTRPAVPSALCVPKWSTRRRYERPTWGPYFGRVAAGLGKPYMPWQQAVMDIAGEVDHRGRFCYNVIVITVPRQSGKTTLVLSITVGRAEGSEAFGGRQQIVYTAQDRTSAVKKFKREFVPELRASKIMKGRYRAYIGAGSEGFQFHDSGSSFDVVSSEEDSAHGMVIDVGVLDEGFAQVDDRVEGAWGPAMLTRPMAQIWFPSTAGNDTDQYYKDKVDAGRLATLADTGYGIAYIEYSADPEWGKEAPYDPALWATCMPALGYTQTYESIQGLASLLKPNTWKRSALNLWVPKSEESILDPTKWAATRNNNVRRITRPIISVDVSYDRKHACIAVAALGDDNRTLLRIAEYREGTDWVGDRLIELYNELDPLKIVIDEKSPAATVVAEAQRDFLPVHITNVQEMVAACGLLYDAVMTKDAPPKVTTHGEPPLEAAVGVSDRRELGDAWAWTRKRSAVKSGADISPLVAITLAYWGQVMFGEREESAEGAW
jgi:hypothetical protein